MHMRAKAICNFQISYRPHTAVIYARRGQWINKINTINNINRDQRSAIRDHMHFTLVWCESRSEFRWFFAAFLNYKHESLWLDAD